MRGAALALVMVAATGCAAHTAPRHLPSTPNAVDELRADLGKIFGAPLMARAAWGVDVRSLDTGETLFEWRPHALMMPASNMKVVTLAVAAETLGWDYRFTTTLETRGTVRDGILHGDLIIRGNGDPSIGRRDGRAARVLDEWAAGLRSAGITRVTGRLVGEDRAFDREWLGAGWAWDYLQYGYAAPSGALQFNENAAELTIAPGGAPGEPALLRLADGSGLVLLNRATTGPSESDPTVAYRRHLHAPVLEVTGSVPAGSLAVVRNVAVVDPTRFFVTSVRTGLAARGIAIEDQAVEVSTVAAELTAGPEPRVVLTTLSPPLRELASVLMKVSQNQYAETFLKASGAASGGAGTAENGRAAVRTILGGWAIPDDTYFVADGSGLSRYNYLNATLLTGILERMYRDDRHRDAFLATFPVAGRDGTTAGRLKRTRAEGNAIAKTGSISNVRALSGYVRTRDGELLVFSILANDFLIPAATVNWIADLAVEVLANFTRR